jgi:hypothetical protein
MAITHQHQGQLRRVQLLILIMFLVALAVVGLTWHRTTTTSSNVAEVTKVVTAYVGHAGFARDLYSVKVTTSAKWPNWALYWELATQKGASTFQNTYGIAEKLSGHWKMIQWGTGMVGCVPSPQHPPVPAAVMRALGSACPVGWN